MQYKFGFFPYTPLDYKAAQDYLDRKAAQGWVLKRLLLGYFAQFEPAQGRRHFVDVCSYAGFGANYDYIQLCSDAGWELIPPTDLHYMVIFRSKPGVDPQPIQSDPNFEWKEFFRKQVRRALRYKALILLLLFAEVAVNPSAWTNYYATVFHASLGTLPFLLFLLCAALLLPVWLWEIGHALRYLSRCRAANAMVSQHWFSAYLRTALSTFLTFAFLILWCIVTASAFL